MCVMSVCLFCDVVCGVAAPLFGKYLVPQAQYVKRPALGMVQRVHYAAVLVERVDLRGLVQHGVEQVHTLLAHRAHRQHRLPQGYGEAQLMQGECRLNAGKVFKGARIVLYGLAVAAHAGEGVTLGCERFHKA